MATNQYGVDTAMWKMLPVEDQNQLITEWNQAHGVSYTPPAVGGYAPGAVTNPPPQQAAPAPAPSSPPASNPSWVFAVNLPSTYPDYSAMKASGSGLVVVADDPNAAALVAGARQWGIPVSIQVNAPPGITPQQYADRVAQAKQQYSPDKLVLDIESVGKGYSGSQGWNWSNQTAALLNPVIGGTSTAITMESGQDDYNYGAYKGLGGNTEYWVQSYLGDMTPVNPVQSRNRLIANGVDPNSITVITGPTQPPPNTGFKWASYGIATNTASAGVYGSNGATAPAPVQTPGTSGMPYYPGQIPVSGAGSGQTGGPPVYVDPGGPYGGGQNAPPPGTPLNQPGYTPSLNPIPAQPPGTPIPPHPPIVITPGGTTMPGANGTPGTTPADETDWAQFYFGSLGLPADVIAKIDDIFRKNDDPTAASQIALAYIRGTPWYAQTFPGIQEGMKLGIVGDERDYRAYVNAINQQSINYQGRAISGSEIGAFLTNGLSVDTVTRQYAGAADINVNRNDYQYYAGNFGDGQLTNPELTGLGQQNAGLGNTVGLRVQRALAMASQRAQKIFDGPLSTPSLSLNKGGLSAPSLSTNQNDIAR
jgi:hypothetical protein